MKTTPIPGLGTSDFNVAKQAHFDFNVVSFDFNFTAPILFGFNVLAGLTQAIYNERDVFQCWGHKNQKIYFIQTEGTSYPSNDGTTSTGGSSIFSNGGANPQIEQATVKRAIGQTTVTRARATQVASSAAGTAHTPEHFNTSSN